MPRKARLGWARARAHEEFGALLVVRSLLAQQSRRLQLVLAEIHRVAITHPVLLLQGSPHLVGCHVRFASV